MFNLLGNKKQKRVYLDYAAATPIRKEVKDVLIKHFDIFANPGTIHKDGVEAFDILQKSKQKIAEAIFCRADEIVFTSSATEANNLALLGVLSTWQKNNLNKIPHIITTNIEHPSVLEVCKKLVRENLAEVTYLKVDEDGVVDIKLLRAAMKENTVLVSIIFASNEIGTIHPIKEISKEIRHFKKHTLANHESMYPLLHSDASQALCYEEIDLRNLGVSTITISSEKIYGPKGVAMLYIKSGTPINKILEGGSQENNLRPGTENVGAIVAFAEAVKLAVSEREVESARIREIQNYCFDELEKNFSGKFIINGSRENRLPNNINITFKEFDSELLVIELDAKGVSVSEKSACDTESGEESYVIEALRSENTGSLRISFGKDTQKSDIDFLITSLKSILKKYQNIQV
jgi:cysteine desulfurase